MMNKTVIENSYIFTNAAFEVCEKLKTSGHEDLSTMLLKSCCNIGINLYKATLFKQPGEIYSFTCNAIQSAVEAEFYLKIISDQNLVDRGLILDLLNKCVYLRKVAERSQIAR